MDILLKRVKWNHKLFLEFQLNLRLTPWYRQLVDTHTHEETKDKKSLNVAVIGVPNAGKSTFINNLINHRVCSF